MMLHASLYGKGIERLRRGVAEKYGVDLQIDYTPVRSYPEHLVKAITEHKTGAAPTFDLMILSDATLARAVAAGITEKVDWKPLLAEGTPPQVIQFDGNALSEHTNHYGFVYNPNVISAQEAPKSLKDLANPKWRGKIAIHPYTTIYLNFAYVLGIDKTLSTLREIMKNDPVVDTYATGLTRYMAGEYPILLTASSFYWEAKKKGVPAQWVSPDISLSTVHAVYVAKGARRPNAAKLLAVFLASPEGDKYMIEEAGAGSVFYPGNFEHDIDQADRKLGLKVYAVQQVPGLLDFMLSEKGAQTEREIGQILKGQ
ncbi:MAG: extracellular solute-binding protein [Candidatus Tectomicrobia bacterium]|uniref:Extracellular solute-binding protein n=1 Tax=Tectimicrobiota bacterium TaxID=2528274 RepID=A0A932M1P1_UNCTE|nr:extracellular solute-binding protein [Candidatus Tectomicrobia bacterium]